MSVQHITDRVLSPHLDRDEPDARDSARPLPRGRADLFDGVAVELEVSLLSPSIGPADAFYGFQAAELAQPPAVVAERFGYVADFAAASPGGTWHLAINEATQGIFVRYTAPGGTFRETSVLSHGAYGNSERDAYGPRLGSIPPPPEIPTTFPTRLSREQLRPAFLQAAAFSGLPPEWADSDALWWILSEESGLDVAADNPSSTAFGLFQMLESTWDSVMAGVEGAPPHGTTDPVWQAVAGFRYIAQVYGTPERAQAFYTATRNGDAASAPEGLQAKAEIWISHGWFGY